MLLIILACTEPKQSDLDAPEIRISPEVSYAGDSLLAEIITAPAYDEGTLSYQYTWYLNDEIQSDLTTDTIEGELVLGHQSWRVKESLHSGQSSALWHAEFFQNAFWAGGRLSQLV